MFVTMLVLAMLAMFMLAVLAMFVMGMCEEMCGIIGGFEMGIAGLCGEAHIGFESRDATSLDGICREFDGAFAALFDI